MQCMTTIKVGLGSGVGQWKLGAPKKKKGHTQDDKKYQLHVALKQRQPQKAQIYAKGANFRKYAGPEFWGTDKGKGVFGSGGWWGL